MSLVFSIIFIHFFQQYVTETFRTDNILNPEYHRFFRVVPAAQVSTSFSPIFHWKMNFIITLESHCGLYKSLLPTFFSFFTSSPLIGATWKNQMGPGWNRLQTIHVFQQLKLLTILMSSYRWIPALLVQGIEKIPLMWNFMPYNSRKD